MTDVRDAVTAEVVRNALAVAAEEASIVVVRSSHSTFIQEGADACSAILDAAGQLVSQSTATSLMHGASLRCSLPALLEDHPLETMAPGDVFAMNDPYRGGIHANDIVVFRPVFADGRPRWFAGTLIHVADVGGSAVGGLAALATDCFSEGLLLPPIRLYIAGEAQRDVFAILRRNSRAPDKVVGDVQALVAGVNTMARRLDELIERYGADHLDRVVNEHLDATEARTRAGLRELPDSTYTGAFDIDGDGLTDRQYHVEVAVTLADGELTADFAGTSPQSGGAINASYSQTLSGVVFAMRCLVDPTLPMNEGCFRPLRAIFPLGTLVNPAPPAACGGRIVTVAAATDAMLRALSDCRPDRAVAASGLIHVWSLSGKGWLNLFYEFGGIGGRAGSDGPDATGCFFLGGRSVIPQIEPMEAQYPFVVRRSKLLPDSGGRGQWRGGLGMETEIELLEDAIVTVRGARMDLPPPGSNGGETGQAGSWFIRHLDGELEELPVRKADVPIAKGETFIVRTSGGGGLGRPEDRDPVLVEADVRDGKVSA
ncbi:MAG: 5-oxoprolinase [Acidimicrobiales bacterium]|nr:5-oxoprolinase [Acidimicrobiales bacterium]